ncbi:hypothetical protein L1987_63838 [Smallanthus sonchifolius]|uniref:Uncharacterized protein n=1 Tax=Smallanthus sonchifolius TaxID=185202 RepID=A0ACB9CE86_9ASTR|nr:hypothetical protein L1987_63838 [Smallanthus sonchifolius]
MFERHWKKPPLSTTNLNHGTLKIYSKEGLCSPFKGQTGQIMLCLWKLQPHCQHLLLLPSAAKKPQATCFCEDKQEQTDHFAANCKFNPFNQILHQAPHKQPTSKRTSAEKPYVYKDKPSAATKSAAAQPKSSAAKSATDKPKPSAVTKSVADKLKSSAAKSAADKANPSAAKARSAADRAKKTGKPSPQQWKAKIPTSIPPRIIIGSVECTHVESDNPRTLFFKDASSWIPPTN